MIAVLYTVGGMLLALAFAALVGVILWLVSHRSPREAAEQLRRLEEDPPAPEAVRACVIGKKTEGYYTGRLKSGTLAYNTRCLVCFKTDTGEERVYDIPPEQYEEIREGDSGMLLTQGGEFFCFGDGEDIPPPAAE